MPVAPDLRGAALDERYELSELLGEGAFGRVYRGRDRRLDRPVAVKVIKPWWGEDPAWAAAFERETRLLAQLSDPGIVQIHDVGHAAEGLFYVSELVEGEDLARRIARLRAATGGGLDPRDAREIALGLCRALAGAHAQRIVHRDVKPANVLLARDGAVKLADFGVARLADATTGDGSLVLGTPRYMAPEQNDGAPGIPATDVYSVGVVLYEMLAGRPPFTGDSPLALALGHLHESPPPLPSTVDPSLVAVVVRALAKNPADRYPDAGAMAQALEHCAARSRAGVDRPGVDRPDADRAVAERAAADDTREGARRGPRVTFHPAARRRSIAMLAIASVVLGAIVAAALFAGSGRSAPAHRPRPLPPRWHTLRTLTGRSSGPITIRGRRWRIIASATSTHSCSWLVFCHSSSVQILRGTSPLRRIALHDGIDVTTDIHGGPGTYRVVVDPAGGSTRWSIRVQDDY